MRRLIAYCDAETRNTLPQLHPRQRRTLPAAEPCTEIPFIGPRPASDSVPALLALSPRPPLTQKTRLRPHRTPNSSACEKCGLEPGLLFAPVSGVPGFFKDQSPRKDPLLAARRSSFSEQWESGRIEHYVEDGHSRVTIGGPVKTYILYPIAKWDGGNPVHGVRSGL
jgi:hypothetical protein